MNGRSLGARLSLATALCLTAAVTATSLSGCGIKLRQVPHGDVDTSTPAGLRSQQLIDMINSNWPIGKQGVATLAAPDKVDEYTEMMTKLWFDRPYKVSSVELADGASSTVHLVAPYGSNVDVGLHTNDHGEVDRMVPNQQPPTISDWSDVESALAKSGGRYSYRVSKVVDGNCEQIAGAHTADPMPLASIFKLYVLLAVGEAIQAGTLSWDTPLTVSDRDKVLGTSITEPQGSTLTVRALAQKMIAVSDNLATDMLIARLGGPAVEKALADAGHHDPASMHPFPTMHDIFTIGWGLPDVRQQWHDAKTSQQRAAILAAANSRDYQEDPARANVPAARYGVEWFASAEDICRVHVALQKIATGPAQLIHDMLASTPGLELNDNWHYIAAKAGNIPGDLTFSWYAVDQHRQPYVVSFQLSWDRAFGPMSAGWVLGIAHSVFNKLD